MAKKRPTEASWDSDEDILLQDTSSVSAFPKKHEDEVIDEDALLGIGGEEKVDTSLQNKSDYEIILDDSAAFDLTTESQELDYEDQEEEDISQSEAEVSQTEVQDGKPVIKAEVFGGGGEGGDSDSEDESGRNKRDRFKTERQTITLKSSTFSTNTVPDIPDNLEVTEEMQQEIDSFEKKGNKGRYFNQGQNNNRGRGNQNNHRGNMRQQPIRGNRPPQNFNQIPPHMRAPGQNQGPGRFQGPGPHQRFGGPGGPQHHMNHGGGPGRPNHRGPAQFPHEMMRQGGPGPGQHQQEANPIPVAVGIGQTSTAPHPFPAQPPFHQSPTQSPVQQVNTIHVNPKFHGTLPVDVHQQHQQQQQGPAHQQQPGIHVPHSATQQFTQPQPVQTHYPGGPAHSSIPPSYHQQQPPIMSSPRPLMEPQRPFMEPPRPHMPSMVPGLMPAPRPLMEPPRPQFGGQPRPLMETPTRQDIQRFPGQQQQMYPPSSMNNNQGPRPQLPTSQFAPHGHPLGMGPRPAHNHQLNQQGPNNRPQLGPNHRFQGPNHQQQGPNQNIRHNGPNPNMRHQGPNQGQHNQGPRGPNPRHPNGQMGQPRHQNQGPQGPQRFQGPNQQGPRPVFPDTKAFNPQPQHFKTQDNQNIPSKAAIINQEKLRKQAEILKKRQERFANQSSASGSKSSSGNLKVLTTSSTPHAVKRPSTDTPDMVSPPKIIKISMNPTVKPTTIPTSVKVKVEPSVKVKVEPIKIKMEIKKELTGTDDSMDVDDKSLHAKMQIELEKQSKQREIIRKMKEAKRVAEATKRRKLLAEKLAKEGKTIQDIEQSDSLTSIQGQVAMQQGQVSQRGNPRGGMRGRAANQAQGQPISVLGQPPQVIVGQQGQNRGQAHNRGQRGHGQQDFLQGRGGIHQGQGYRQQDQIQFHSNRDRGQEHFQQNRGQGQIQGQGRGGLRTRGRGGQNVGQVQGVQNNEFDLDPNVNINVPILSESNRTVVTPNITGTGAACEEPARLVFNQNRTVLANTGTQRRIVMNSSELQNHSCVSIEGLSSGEHLGRINTMCAKYGEIKVFDFKPAEHKIRVRFGDPIQASHFIEKQHKFLMDMNVLTARLIDDF